MTHTLARRTLLFVLVTAITLIMQFWVGGSTVYSDTHVAQREAMHQYMLDNRPPPGKSWNDLGAQGINLRIGAVYLAEGVHRVLGIRVTAAYFWIDTLALAAGLLLLVAYLGRWFNPQYQLLGLLYFTSTLPLTYVLFYYHPWDRLALCLWIILLMLLQADRLAWFAMTLVASILVKYDSVLLPGLYWLVHVSRANWKRVSAVTMALFTLSFGTFALLLWTHPAPPAPFGIGDQLGVNLEVFRQLWKAYPPALGFALPVVLAVIGFRASSRFMQACAIFGALLFVPFFLRSNFAEFRAEVPALVLLLPCALRGLQVLLTDQELGRSLDAVAT